MTRQLKALVCGAGGFIGHHLTSRLANQNYHVTGVDLKYPEFSKSQASEFILADLRDEKTWRNLIFDRFDEVYQLAADMGGAGYIFTGKNDANVMYNSAMINLNAAKFMVKSNSGKFFYSSSACVYPAENQNSTHKPTLKEDTAYPANPDSEYGWEKLFSERLFLAYMRNYGLNVKIARFHNVFGPEGAWKGGKEKAPAAICRKIAEIKNGGEIEIWGDGEQTRSFLYIDECLNGIQALMKHPSFSGPVNIGSDEMVSINQLVALIKDISQKDFSMKHIDGPQGVRGRTSDNELIYKMLNWKPNYSLKKGLKKTYKWIEAQVNEKN